MLKSPPYPLNNNPAEGLLQTNTANSGTLLNVVGIASFLDFYPAAIGQSGADLTTPIQNFLLDCQLKRYAIRNNSIDGIILAGVVVAKFPPGYSFAISSPIVIPEHVAIDSQGCDFRRVGQTSVYSTNLTGSYTSGGTTMAVASISGLPAFPFYIKVDSEVLKVTANPSGLNLTVAGAQLGTSAANHSSGGSKTVNTVSTFYTGDTTSFGCYVLEQPTLIFPGGAHNFSLGQIYCNTNGSDRGSGYVCGKNWTLASVALASAGNAQYKAGDVLTFPQPSAEYYLAPQLTVVSTDGAGGTGTGNIVTWTLARTDGKASCYALPPALQAKQWTPANGFPNSGTIAAGDRGAVFDVSMNFLTSSNNAGGGTGSGATFTPTWTQDFSGSGADYYMGIYFEAGIYSGDMNVYQSGVTNDAVFGHTFGAGFSGGQHVMGEVTTQSGYYGVWLNGCTDCFWKNLNPVDAGVGLKIGPGGGGLRGFVTVDSPTLAYIEQDHADNINIVADFLQKNGSSYTGSYCMLMGSAGNSTNLNSATTYMLNISENCGTSGGIPALSIANTVNFDISVNIANTLKSGSAATYLVTSVAALGSNVTKGQISGTIDGSTGLISGTIDPSVGYNIWDSVNDIRSMARVKNPTGELVVPPVLYPQTGFYYTSGFYSGKGTVSAPNSAGNSIATVIPYFLSKAMTPVSMAMEVTTGATLGNTSINMGIYADNGGIPGTLLLDISTTATGAKTLAAAATGVQQMAIPANSLLGGVSILPPGLYWLALTTTVPTTIGSLTFKSLQTNNTIGEWMMGDTLTQGSASPSAPALAYLKTNGSDTFVLPASGYGRSAAGSSPPAIWIGF